jgi:hypothetical protein
MPRRVTFTSGRVSNGVMPLIRTQKQRDNLAKFLYDVAKIVLTIAVIAPVVNFSVFSYLTMIGGIVAAAIFFSAAFMLDGEVERS